MSIFDVSLSTLVCGTLELFVETVLENCGAMSVENSNLISGFRSTFVLLEIYMYSAFPMNVNQQSDVRCVIPK